MDPYKPIELPYFAPSHTLLARLPNLHQILSSTDFIKYNDTTVVFRVGEHFIVKYGSVVRPVEGENMLFVKNHTTLPIPALYAIKTFDEDKTTMLIMEHIKGKPLSDFPRMRKAAFLAIAERLKAQINELRSIASPGYYGRLGRRPFEDIQRSQYGPFDTLRKVINKELFDGMFSPRTSQSVIDLEKHFLDRFELVATAQGPARPVFSHGDLHGENIIIRPNHTPCIIDWGRAGFYPAYHEYFVRDELIDDLDVLEDQFPDVLEVLADAWRAASNIERERQV
jgi:aminoglycoside phosphotransferase